MQGAIWNKIVFTSRILLRIPELCDVIRARTEQFGRTCDFKSRVSDLFSVLQDFDDTRYVYAAGTDFNRGESAAESLASLRQPFGTQVLPMYVEYLVVILLGEIDRIASAQPLITGIEIDAQSLRIIQSLHDIASCEFAGCEQERRSEPLASHLKAVRHGVSQQRRFLARICEQIGKMPVYEISVFFKAAHL